jgi:hypothetical protein
VAANCWTFPAAIVAVAGVNAIDVSVAVLTFSVTTPVIDPQLAVIAVLPAVTPVARPVLLIVAVDGVPEDHDTAAFRFSVLPSLKFPVALNCSPVPAAITGSAGVSVMDVRLAVPTVSSVDPATAPALALMFAGPGVTAVATPCDPLWLLIVATAGVSELQSAVPVIFCVVPSLNVPVAVNPTVKPAWVTGIAGVTATEVMIAVVTVAFVDPVIPPALALMLLAPAATAVNNPVLPTVAAPGFTAVHVAALVKS